MLWNDKNLRLPPSISLDFVSSRSDTVIQINFTIDYSLYLHPLNQTYKLDKLHHVSPPLPPSLIRDNSSSIIFHLHLSLPYEISYRSAEKQLRAGLEMLVVGTCLLIRLNISDVAATISLHTVTMPWVLGRYQRGAV